MNWLSVTLSWYFALLLLGLVFVPLTRAILGRYFYDRAYPFAKTIGILFMSYGLFVLGLIKILRFETSSIALLTIAFLGLNAWLVWRWQKKVGSFTFIRDRKAIAFVVFEELLFLVSLVAFMLVRGQEPSIHGLEKFMDYGFMMSIFRTEYFPPLDMWLSADPVQPAGYFVNYYYFGHLVGTFLIKLTGVRPELGYNLVLGTLFAQGITMGFSLCSSIVYNIKRSMFGEGAISKIRLVFYGILGTYLINLAGNLHTIYAFTKGYDPDNPVPFWTIFLTLPEMFDPNRPATYWYPNATRFIPKTIHEFPSYSYVVADLHGHVFDIPFVLLTLALLFSLTMYAMSRRKSHETASEKSKDTGNAHAKTPAGKKHTVQAESKGTANAESRPGLAGRLFGEASSFSHEFLTTLGIHIGQNGFRYAPTYDTVLVMLLGFMTAVHYMTNALNGPIYILFSVVVLFFCFGLSNRFLTYVISLGFAFFVFSYPFSMNFSPFASGIGVNCAPGFLTDIERIGPFLFEKGNCQRDPFWMLFVLWGFFWTGLVLYLVALFSKNSLTRARFEINLFGKKTLVLHPVDVFVMLLFAFGTFLILVPSFFYVKDIYPDHFRANTMFKLGYQAFIMMSIATTVALFRLRLMASWWRFGLKGMYALLGFLVAIYPYFAFPSYYPGLLDGTALKRGAKLDGIVWLKDQYPQDHEIVQYFNTRVEGQPVILEAQGDSYTDYNRVSAYTGLPTVAGWWVHEWLWRGSADVVGSRIPDIETIYNTDDPAVAQRLLQKYNVDYVVVSGLEKEKYKTLNEEKFEKIATRVFVSENGVGSIYKITK